MMIYYQPGEEFWHEGVCYKVGGRIVANEASDYAGLFGNILEIRTEDDRETDNDTPDIYCAFEAPVLSADRLALEQTFSQLYREQKHIEDLGLDMVIMGPEMIVPLEHPAQVYPAETLYIVVVHWATDGEYGSYEAIFTERTDALHQFHNDLREEFLAGSIPRWKESSQFVEEESDNSYECYLDGEYCENHFSIALEQRALPLSPAFCRSTAELYRAECLRDDFREHIENRDDFQELSDTQKEALLRSPDLPQRITNQLEHSCAYGEAYWQAVSDVARTLLKELRQQSAGHSPC